MPYVNILTTAGNEYDSSSSYQVGDICTYNGTAYRCIKRTSGDWNDERWVSLGSTPLTLDKSYSSCTTLAAILPTHRSDTSTDDPTLTITVNYTTPSDVSRDDMLKISDLLDNQKLRSLLWINDLPTDGILSTVSFENWVSRSFPDDGTDEAGTWIWSLFSPLCTMTMQIHWVLSPIGPLLDSVTINIIFNQTSANIYTLLKSYMMLPDSDPGHYPGITLVPVISSLI